MAARRTPPPSGASRSRSRSRTRARPPPRSCWPVRRVARRREPDRCAASRTADYPPPSMEDWLDPLYDADGMRDADRWAIEERGIPSLELMEAAGRPRSPRPSPSSPPSGPVRVVCGKGNNGGDGLVAARHLAAAGLEVEVLLLWPAGRALARTRPPTSSGSAAASARSAPARSPPPSAARARSSTRSSAPASPARRATRADAAIEAINACRRAGRRRRHRLRRRRLDRRGRGRRGRRRRDGQLPRRQARPLDRARQVAHRRAAGGADRDPRSERRPTPAAGLIGDGGARARSPRRGADSTKFSSGQVLIVGGSRGLTGAVCMAAEAAIRAGAGYATVAVPARARADLRGEADRGDVASAAPAPTGRLAAGDRGARSLDAAERAAAVVLGPGLGRDEDSLELARELAAGIEAPLLIDADGLNALAGRLELARRRARRRPCSPRTRASSAACSSATRPRSTRTASRSRSRGRRARRARSSCSRATTRSSPTATGSRSTALGSPALATAGTGDVLSGMIGGAARPRHSTPFAAACAAVLAHARAGRLAAERRRRGRVGDRHRRDRGAPRRALRA